MRNKYSSRHPSCQPSTSHHKDSTSMAARSEAHNDVLKSGGTHKQAVEANVSGNKWSIENAKSVGNI